MGALSLVTAYTNAGRLAFGSVGAGYTVLLAAVSGSVRKIVITNSLNQEVVLSINNATNDFIYLPALQGIVIDLDNSMHWSGIVQVKHNGVAPTGGAISAGVILGT